MPVRIQRQQTRGWRTSENTVYVGRRSLWGNPFIVGSPSGIFDGQNGHPLGLRDQVEVLVRSLTIEQSIQFYRDMISGHVYPEMFPFGHDWTQAFHRKIRGTQPSTWVRSTLKGKNLACWCALDHPCHADVLIEIANAPLYTAADAA